FLDLLVDFGDTSLQEAVALVLAVDLGIVVTHDQERQHDGRQRRQRQHQHGVFLTLLAALSAPREKVDPCHQSKLLRASPQAIINAGASWANAWACTRGPRVMWASGLAIIVGTPSCSSTIAAMPAIAAQPPASTI